MKTLKITLATLFAALVLTSTAGGAFAQDDYFTEKKFEATVLGGVQALMSNDTAIPDDFVNIPLAASLGYRLNRIFALEGELAWLIPVSNTVTVAGGEQDLKNPDVLTYQANVRAQLPIGSAAFLPYVTAGAGAMTFLSATDADTYPQVSDSQTEFAINFGLGASIPVTESLSLRGDFREFVAFPRDDAPGLSDGTNADPIWMPRGTFGATYRF